MHASPIYRNAIQNLYNKCEHNYSYGFAVKLKVKLTRTQGRSLACLAHLCKCYEISIYQMQMLLPLWFQNNIKNKHYK